MNSWVLATFAILAGVMLAHSAATYIKRELDRKPANTSTRS